jgi:pimeloyl-ACP methyl ester carboxylesterase
MQHIEAGADAQGNPVKLLYTDWGHGNPVVLIHGWPLDHQMWEYQSVFLAKRGLRIVTYDRRGFGKSSHPWQGYDYDTLADDLKAVLDGLDLQNVTLVGFSMGGGEVARYMSRHAGARVSKVAFVSAVTPFLLKTNDNPEGVDQSVFDEMLAGLNKDRADFLNSFGTQFYGSGPLGMGAAVSAAELQWTLAMAMPASPKATLDCVTSFSATDFRADLATIEVPSLVIHGSSDKTVPISVSGERTAKMLRGARYLVYEGEGHGLHLTAKDRLNQDLLDFIGGSGRITL